MPKKSDAAKAPEPMDSGAPERSSAGPIERNQRVCYSLVALNNEVNDLFPGGPIPTYSHPNAFNTLLAVSYDASMMDDEDRADFMAVMTLLDQSTARSDRRIESVTVDETEQSVFVEMRSSLRTQDDRTEFGLARALHVLAEDGSL